MTIYVDHIDLRRKHLLRKIAGCLAAAVLLPACSGSDHSALAPASREAESIADLWWVMLAGGTVIFVAVLVLLLVGLIRGRGRESRPLNERQSRYLVLAGGVVIPVFILFALVIGSVFVGKSVVSETVAADVTVEVVGRLWWWEVHYLDKNNRRIATTANEIHVPVGKRVRFLLVSDNVIHSFWVPSLQGKVDLIPGQINTVSFVPRTAGVFPGVCAEFCGIQHAKMGLLVIAQPEDEFHAWLREQALPAREPDDPVLLRGKQVFLSSSCIECHTIRGTPADKELGPDLTHVGSRLTLAATAIPNTIGYAGGWLVAPQHIKPGSLMPPTPLEPEDLRALAYYLQSLK